MGNQVLLDKESEKWLRMYEAGLIGDATKKLFLD